MKPSVRRLLAGALVVATVSAGSGVFSSANATPLPVGYGIEYPLNSNTAVGPTGITTTSDGAVWFSSYSLGSIGRFVLPTTINQYSIASPNARPTDIITGPDGNIWFTEGAYDHIGRLATSKACLGTITEFDVTGANGGGTSGLVADHAGNIWFSAAGGDLVSSFSAAAADQTVPTCANLGVTAPSVMPLPSVTTYQLPANSGPTALAADASGQIWVAEPVSNSVGRIDPTVAPTRPMSEYLAQWTIATAGANVTDIASGAGNYVWFTESDANRVGRISASAVSGDASAVTDFAVPTANSAPTGISAGSDGQMWFTEANGPGALGRLSATGQISEFATPPMGGALIYDLAPASSGAFWYTNFYADTVGQLSTGFNPARATPTISVPHIGALTCGAATWSTTPTSSSTTLFRGSTKLATTSTTISASSLGQTFVCRSEATLPGLTTTFTSTSSRRVTALIARAAYAMARKHASTVAVLSASAQSVLVQIARTDRSGALTSVRVALRKGTTNVAPAVTARLTAGRYVVRIASTDGTALAVAALTLR